MFFFLNVQLQYSNRRIFIVNFFDWIQEKAWEGGKGRKDNGQLLECMGKIGIFNVFEVSESGSVGMLEYEIS